MRASRKHIDPAHAPVDQRIGFVHDAQGCFSAGNECQRAADILGPDQPVLNVLPDAERNQRAARVSAGRYRVRIPGGESSTAQGCQQPEVRCDPESDGAVGRCNQYQPVPQQIPPGGRIDEVPRLQIVHPLLVSTDEDIRPCTVLELSGEHRTGGERESHRQRGGAGEFIPGLLQDIREGSCAEYSDRVSAAGCCNNRQRRN